jgi:hypothetical protein
VTQSRRLDLVLGALLLLGLPLLFFPELIFGGQTLTRMDITWIQYPLHVFAAESLRAGQWPIWNPYALFGFAAFAEQQASMLSPLNSVFLLPIPSYLALNWFVLLHVGLAAASTFALARTLGVGPAGAVLAGLSFGFGGTLTAQITDFCTMTGMAWMPAALCLIILSNERRSRAWPILTGVVVALQILDAQGQLVFYTVLLLGAYTIYESVRLIRRRATWLEITRPARVLVLTGLVSFGLSAVQLLPTLELLHEALRSHGMSLKEITSQSIHPLQLLELLIPNVYGNPVLGYKGLDSFEELFAYFGLLPLFLLLPAWRRRSTPHARFLWLALPVVLLLALGGYTPLYTWLQGVPGFNLFRIPGRWMMVISLVWALLAGYGLDELSRSDRTTGPARTLIFLMGGATVVLGGLAVWIAADRLQLRGWVTAHFGASESGRLLNEALKRFLLPADARASNWLPNLAPWLTISGLAFFVEMALALAVLGMYLGRRLSARAVAIILVGITAADLLAAGGTSVIHLEDASYWQGDPRIVDLVRDKTGLSRAFSLDATSLEEKRATNGWAGRHEAIDWLTYYMPTVVHIASPMGKRTGLVMERYERFIGDVPSLRVTDMGSLKTIVAWGELSADLKAIYPEIYAAGLLHIYNNPAALPRAYWSGRAESVPDGPAALARISAPDFDPYAAVVVEATLPPSQGSAAPLVPAAIPEYTPNHVRIDVEAPADGWLVLTDTWYPGWHATVDGRAKPISRANYLFRGVPVPAGKHTVEFVYWPASFFAGLIITSTTAILLAATALFLRLRRRTVAGGLPLRQGLRITPSI